MKERLIVKWAQQNKLIVNKNYYISLSLTSTLLPPSSSSFIYERDDDCENWVYRKEIKKVVYIHTHSSCLFSAIQLLPIIRGIYRSTEWEREVNGDLNWSLACALERERLSFPSSTSDFNVFFLASISQTKHMLWI
jgi:hypothetical protein